MSGGGTSSRSGGGSGGGGGGGRNQKSALPHALDAIVESPVSRADVLRLDGSDESGPMPGAEATAAAAAAAVAARRIAAAAAEADDDDDDGGARGARLREQGLLAEFEAKAAIDAHASDRELRAGGGVGAASAAGGGPHTAMATTDALSLRRPAAERLRLIAASASAERARPASAAVGGRPALGAHASASASAHRGGGAERFSEVSGNGLDRFDGEEEDGPALTRRLVRLLQDVAAERDGLRRQLDKAHAQLAALQAQPPPAAGAAAAAALSDAERDELARLRVEGANLWGLLDENKALRAQLAQRSA
jgi:hypothetical protein